jgi:hypothetical protein
MGLDGGFFSAGHVFAHACVDETKHGLSVLGHHVSPMRAWEERDAAGWRLSRACMGKPMQSDVLGKTT